MIKTSTAVSTRDRRKIKHDTLNVSVSEGHTVKRGKRPPPGLNPPCVRGSWKSKETWKQRKHFSWSFAKLVLHLKVICYFLQKWCVHEKKRSKISMFFHLEPNESIAGIIQPHTVDYCTLYGGKLKLLLLKLLIIWHQHHFLTLLLCFSSSSCECI